MPRNPGKQRCSQLTAAGVPCRAKAIHSTTPSADGSRPCRPEGVQVLRVAQPTLAGARFFLAHAKPDWISTRQPK